jgi:hypothetical protein
MEYYDQYERQHNKLLQEFKKDHTETLTLLTSAPDALNTLYNYYHLKYQKNEHDLRVENIHEFMPTFEGVLPEFSYKPTDAFNFTLEALNISCDEDKVKLLAMNTALSIFLKGLKQCIIDLGVDGPSSSSPKYKYWIGKETTEFVQLIYGLIEAGRLLGTSRIQMIKDIAQFLSIDLKKGWQSDLSKSIHERNLDYSPGIFSDIENAWDKYCLKLQQAKETK